MILTPQRLYGRWLSGCGCRRRRHGVALRRFGRSPTAGHPQDPETKDRCQRPHEPTKDRDQTEQAEDPPSRKEGEEPRRRWPHEEPTNRLRAGYVSDCVEEPE